MTPFRLYFERRKRNPLRQEELLKSGKQDFTSPEFMERHKDYYKNYPIEDMEDSSDKVIKRKYEGLLKSSESLAEKYLEYEINNFIKTLKRPTTKQYKKIYEYQGVQVFLDEANVEDTDYSPGSPNYNKVKHCVLVMLVYVRDIIPNKKPKIVITDLMKNEYTGAQSDPNSPAAAMAYSKNIYIDEKYMDEPTYYVHELAHWIADLIPNQTAELLRNNFKKLIDMYYKASKKKKPDTGKPLTNSERAKISKKLGLPEYGLTNHDEFFAVLIESWKMLPANKWTYKMKSLVKDVLTRL